jgi:hypothetical protein
MTIRWKDNFKTFTMEQFMEVEAEIKDNMEGGDDELRND